MSWSCTVPLHGLPNGNVYVAGPQHGLPNGKGGWRSHEGGAAHGADVGVCRACLGVFGSLGCKLCRQDAGLFLSASVCLCLCVCVCACLCVCRSFSYPPHLLLPLPLSRFSLSHNTHVALTVATFAGVQRAVHRKHDRAADRQRRHFSKVCLQHACVPCRSTGFVRQ